MSLKRPFDTESSEEDCVVVKRSKIISTEKSLSESEDLSCDEKYSLESEDLSSDNKSSLGGKDLSSDNESSLGGKDLPCDKKKKKLGLPPFYHCIECFNFMGETNPRQFCYKLKCPYAEDFNEKDLLQIKVSHLRTSPYYKDKTSLHYSDFHDVIQEFIDEYEEPYEFSISEDFLD